jgi:hypothetical protein
MSYIKTYDLHTYEVTIEGEIIKIKTWYLFFVSLISIFFKSEKSSN